METTNVVIDEALDFGSGKISEEIPKEILPPEPKGVQEIVDQELASPRTPTTSSVVEVSADIPTSPDSESHEEKGHSLRIKLNHPPEVIVGNMNELTLRKRTVDKCVAMMRKLSRMKARLRLCMMNCFSFKGMMSRP